MFKQNQVAACFLKSVNMAGNVIEKLQMLCYLENVFCTEGKVQETVTAKIRAGWKKFKNITRFVCKKGLWVKLRRVCIQNVHHKCNELWSVVLANKGKRYKKNGVHLNQNALNDM